MIERKRNYSGSQYIWMSLPELKDLQYLIDCTLKAVHKQYV